MVSDLLKKMAVLTKISSSLGQNAQIDWQELVTELFTRKYLSFRGKDKEAQILTFISGFAFFLSSSYDLGSDYLVSDQFITGTEYIKEVHDESELERYHLNTSYNVKDNSFIPFKHRLSPQILHSENKTC